MKTINLKQPLRLIASLVFIGLIVYSFVACEKQDNVDISSLGNDNEVVENLDSEIDFVTASDIDFSSEDYLEFRREYLITRKQRPVHDFIPEDKRFVPTESDIEIDYVSNLNLLKLFKIEGLEGITDPEEAIEIINNKSNNIPLSSIGQGAKYSFTSTVYYDITEVPFYSEWDSNENPNGYYWCGHASLKCVGKKHGTFKTLDEIHKIFSSNSSTYVNDGRCNNGKYCASMLDLLYATNVNKNGSWNYNFPSSSTEIQNNISSWYQRLKDGVVYDKPAIVASFYEEPVGHFYPVVGYIERYLSDGSIDYNASQLLLRDVKYLSAQNWWGERIVSVTTFYNYRNTNQILFVRP